MPEVTVHSEAEEHELFLSIVIPAYNEAGKIGDDVRAATSFLADEGIVGEVIVVDDGSRDNTAKEAEAVEVPEKVKLRVLSYKKNSGKGFAVKTGIIDTRGRYVMFADSGNPVPYVFALRGLEIIQAGEADVANGSRKMEQSVVPIKQPLYRRIISKAFRIMSLYLLDVPQQFTDTQCGFKVYKGNVGRRLYGECKTRGFLFDIEIILRALYEGYKVKEFPVQWSCDYDSRLDLMQTPFEIMKEYGKLRKVVKQLRKASIRKEA